MRSNKHQDITWARVAKLLGLATRSLGKAETRQCFLPLCNELKEKPYVIEVMDRDKPAVIILSKTHFDILINKLWRLVGPMEKAPQQLLGSITIRTDLESASRKASDKFKKAVTSNSDNLR